jgi:hypothetical protein
VTKIKIQDGGTSGQKNASDLGKPYKYGYFQALIVEILHGILLEIFSSNVSIHSTTWTFMLPNPMLIITKED